MCGIVGGFGAGSSDIIRQNIDSLNRRGPDSQAIKLFKNGLTLGSTRLAMTDPLPRSNQPMVDKFTGNALVFNGEIYNFKIIRENLTRQGIIFETESDTEVLLKALTYHGASIIMKLEGMFSFVFYDSRKNSLIIARDYLGKKPLYYFLGENKFFFASQAEFISKYIKGLELNLQSIQNYLKLGYLIDPNTMFEKIQSILPGEIITINLANLTIVDKNIYSPISISNPRNTEISEAVSNALVERVTGHNRFAISLSGGIDSSVLAMECSRLGFAAEAYSMSWRNSDKERYQNDAVAAKKIASQIGLSHKIIEMPKPNELSSILNEYVKAMGEPNSNPSGLSMMILYAAIAKDHHRLVLTGDGADEVFGGYKRYELVNKIRLSPSLNSRYFKKFLLNNEPRSKLMKYLLLSIQPKDSSEFWLHWHSITRDSYINRLIKELPKSIPSIYGGELADIYTSKNISVSNMMFKDLKTWLSMESNRKLDRISMWHSIEARSPFQSENVIGVGYRKMNDFNFTKVKKELIFEAFPKIKTLPTLSSKSGFISPLGYWLRNNTELIEHSLENITNYLPFEKKELRIISRAGQNGNHRDFKLLWSLIVLNSWFEING